jgi:hypothetical protein
VLLLLKSNKESPTTVDLNTRVPLMHAVSNGCSLKAVMAIHRAAPKLLSTEVDKNKKNILHFISPKTPLKVVELLLAEAPAALIQTRDGYSKFPVQNAIGFSVKGKVCHHDMEQ